MSSFGAKRKARVIRVAEDDDETMGDAPAAADGADSGKEGKFFKLPPCDFFADDGQG